MEHEFWIDAWKQRQIGFHNPAVHPMLEAHISKFNLPSGARIFVPLCGKTLDIHWLLSQGYRVAGAELVETAIQELFEKSDVTPSVKPCGKMKLYQAENIDIFVGDLFVVSAADLGPVDCVYDRAALVALPAGVRQQYSKHILDITQAAPQLLITFDYDQDAMAGPPFFVSDAEIAGHYASVFQIDHIERKEMEELLKGQVPAVEVARHLYG